VVHDPAVTQPDFSVYPLRLHFKAGRNLQVENGTAANLIRGQFGKILLREHPDDYRQCFAPAQSAGAGPSGFRDPPRPFVLRVAELEGIHIDAGARFVIGVNLFETRRPPIDLFRDVLTRVACESLGAATLESLEGTARLDFSLHPAAKATRVRVHFRTATELKGISRPDFGSLFSRIRDRVSGLRALYGEGPLDIDFRGMGDRAAEIAMTHCDLRHERSQRYSRTQGAAHSLGGFLGVAEYGGDLTEFLPYLEAARWTGVGRQTVWGKGEIHCETI
jgi:CRISPR-associated endoribonuclease Cas6